MQARMLIPLVALLCLAAVLLDQVDWDPIAPDDIPALEPEDSDDELAPVFAPENPTGLRSEALGSSASENSLARDPEPELLAKDEEGARFILQFDLPENMAVHDFVLFKRSRNTQSREIIEASGYAVMEVDGVRFVHLSMLPGRSLYLELQSWDEIWRSGETLRRVEREPQSLTCVLAQTAVVDVYASEPGRRAPPKNWELQCESTSPHASEVTQVVQANGDVSSFAWPIDVEPIMGGRGRRVTRLLPGPYRFAASASRHSQDVAEPVLSAGQRQAIHLELVPLAIGGDISGTIRRVSGKGKDPLGTALISNTILIQSIGPEPLEFRANIHWSAQGQGTFIGYWRVPDVPIGTYHVRPLSDGWVAIEPSGHQVAPPAEHLQFIVMDTAVLKDIGFDVVSAADGTPISGARVVFHLTHGGTAQTVFASGTVARWNVPSDSPVTWDLSADGFESRSGTVADFDEVRMLEEKEAWFARVELTPSD